MIRNLQLLSCIALAACDLRWGQHPQPVDASTDTSLAADAGPSDASNIGDASITVDASPDAPLSTARELTAFGFVTTHNPGLAFDVTAMISGASVDVTVPAGTNLTSLTATFTTTGASVTVAGFVQASGVTVHDFTSPVVYRVTAADGSTKDYTVTVRVAAGFVFARTDLATGEQPTFLATADVNGDGRPDLAISTAGSPAVTPGSVSVVLNTTAPNDLTPSFSSGASYLVNQSPWSIMFSDINGDGLPDLVSTTGPSAFAVLLNTTTTNATTPSFASPVGFGSAGGNALGAADINRDGKPDVIVVAVSGLSVYLNTTAANASTPTFSANVDFLTGPVPFAVAFGDLDGDGAVDVAVANEGGNTVSIFRNTTVANATTPSFATKVDFVTGVGASPTPYSVAIADIDGDGRPDLAVANGHQSVSTISTFLNTTPNLGTTISFAPKLDLSTGSGPTCVALGDLDHDGKPDLAVTNNYSASVSVFRDLTAPAASSPAFAVKQDIDVGTYPRYLVIEDFDGDGNRDVAVSNQGASSVSILLAR